MVQFGVQMRSNTFLYIMSGLKVMYFPVGGSDFTYIIHNEELSESREIFGLRLESPQNSLQGSLVLGGGMSHAFKKILVRANVIYVMNFQNTIEGEYQFDLRDDAEDKALQEIERRESFRSSSSKRTLLPDRRTFLAEVGQIDGRFRSTALR